MRSVIIGAAGAVAAGVLLGWLTIGWDPEENEDRLPDPEPKSYRISAEVDIPEGGASGVLATQGGRSGGWALLLLDGKGGRGTLLVDGSTVAEGRIESVDGRRFAPDETFDLGHDLGTPVVEDYADRMPYRFGGRLQKVAIELKPRGGELPSSTR